MTVAAPQQPMTIAVAAAAAPIAVIVDVAGVSPVASAASLRERLAATAFCWLDIFGGSDAERNELLSQTGFEEIDTTWIQRFGRAGRVWRSGSISCGP